MQLFYNTEVQHTNKQFVFNKTESRHIVRVLRKKNGDELFITNGKGELFISRIIDADDKNCTVEIISVDKKQKSWNYYLHIAIAPTKNIDRYEWFLEKATEIGIDEITPILCDHSERKIIKMDRSIRIIEAAMKQSLKFQMPKLNSLTHYADFLQKKFEGNLCIAHCEKTDKKSLKSIIKTHQNTIILIGPEGDFSTDEIRAAIANAYTPITLGESRLRTETAAIVAAQIVSFINQ